MWEKQVKIMNSATKKTLGMTEPFQCHNWLLTSQEIKVLAEWVNTILQSEDGADSAVGASSTPSSSCAAAATPQVAPKRGISKRDSKIAGPSFADEVLLALRASAFRIEGALAQRLTSRRILWRSSHDLLAGLENSAIEPMFAFPLRK